MIQIEVAGNKKEFSSINDIDEPWINQQINRRQNDNLLVCVRIYIKQDSVDIGLSTPTCQGRGGSKTQFSSKDTAVYELWQKLGLNKDGFSSGNVIAFLKQLRKILN
jgi:hypothetical protein